ncbi:MAG: bacteriocin family protein [Candidatus Brocadiaceae bacterium]|nr:bacteriocin family protein [Candidatus Brocadiaceae bacterium]
MRAFSKRKNFHHVTGIFVLMVMSYLFLGTSTIFAKCAKEDDCLSCHSSQELRKVHKDCQYLKQGCLACHTAPATLSDYAKAEEGSPYACSQGETAYGRNDPRFAEIGSDIQIGQEDWEKLKRTVHETTERHLVGRKFIEVYGPLGAGIQSAPLDTYAIPSWASVDMLGESNEAIHSLKRDIVHIPLIYKDFWLFWRDMEANKKCETPLDVSAAVGASVAAAAREDDLIFNGMSEMGISGLLNADGRNILKLSDWSVIGNGFQDVVSATEKLASLGIHGPYILVVNPKLYALLHKVYERTGELEIEGVKELVCGVYRSSVIKKDVALVVAKCRQNMDLAVGANFHLEYWGSQDLNHRFRVVGSSVLRIKTPQAICTLE